MFQDGCQGESNWLSFRFVEVHQFGFNRLMTSNPNTPVYSTSKPRPLRRLTRRSSIWDFVHSSWMKVSSTGCIKGFFEAERYVENGIRTTNPISIFYALKSIMKVKLFLMSLSLFLEKFNFYYTFQGTKYANGICSFYTIFNILFCFKKPFYAPCACISTKSRSVSIPPT